MRAACPGVRPSAVTARLWGTGWGVSTGGPRTSSPPWQAAQAAADQKIVQSKRAVEIETLKAQAEVEPLLALAGQLEALKANLKPFHPRRRALQ